MESNLSADFVLPELALWDCCEAVPGLSEIQASTMLSLTLGAQHSYEARSMFWALFSILRPAYIVEIGANHGLTSAFMWKLGALAGEKPKVITFDIAMSKLAPNIWQSIGAADSISLISGDSAEMIPKNCKPGVEFALIDGDHTYAGAKRDWDAIAPLLSARSVVLFDNMLHGDGCGQLFARLDPLWFHPEMAMVARGLTGAEFQSIFISYIHRKLPIWLRALTTEQGDEIRDSLRLLLQVVKQPLSDYAAQHNTADLCRQLTALALNGTSPRLSAVMRLSAQYGIGTAAQAQRQRVKEAFPIWLRPFLSRVFHFFKPFMVTRNKEL